MLLSTVMSVVLFLTGGVFECDFAHRRYVAVLSILFKIGCSSMHPLYGAFPELYVPICGLNAVLWSYISILMRLAAAGPRSSPGLLFSSQCIYGTIFLTLYSMVCNWLVVRVLPILFYWPKSFVPVLSSTVFPFSYSDCVH